jgi:hypothetical protein
MYRDLQTYSLKTSTFGSKVEINVPMCTPLNITQLRQCERREDFENRQFREISVRGWSGITIGALWEYVMKRNSII